MFASLIIGLAIIVVGAVLSGWMLFGQNGSVDTSAHHVHSTLTAPPTNAVATAGGSQVSSNTADTAPVATGRGRFERRPGGVRDTMGMARRDGSRNVKVGWLVRLRSAALLVLITVGIGTVIGALFGMVALAASFVIG
ncbi:MAG: hypothetical protein M9952_16135 [Microthrixaceae bacterium]|nr:hypothetical protein [Microthrixaceae bacterium]MCO5314453.1 hypothetical protein [Microthrixaceae bacterium]HPB46664.1 hypothetical protein [Microthrixaceae bacterium]